jgi:mono/diheme cytochrome c family protein
MTSRVFAGGILWLFLSSVSGQDKTPVSVWDGIYTDPQAARGENAYREACASCHGANLEGRGQTPALAGRDFTSRWNGMSVGDLFEKMQVSMPADRPGQLGRDQMAGILAFILKFNKFPAGSKELPANADSLKDVRFEAERTGK